MALPAMTPQATLTTLATAVLIATLSATPRAAGPGPDDASDRRLTDVAAVVADILDAPTDRLSHDVLARARCIVVVPHLDIGRFVVRGEDARGYLSCRTTLQSGWSAPGAVRVTGGRIGFQIGGPAADLIVLAMTEKAVGALLAGRFELGDGAAVAAGPVGTGAFTPTDAQRRADLLSWSRSRGVLAGVGLEGATVREDVDENAVLYGTRLRNRDIVTRPIPPPAAAARLLALLNRYGMPEGAP